jgi:hypothetical protein
VPARTRCRPDTRSGLRSCFLVPRGPTAALRWSFFSPWTLSRRRSGRRSLRFPGSVTRRRALLRLLMPTIVMLRNFLPVTSASPRAFRRVAPVFSILLWILVWVRNRLFMKTSRLRPYDRGFPIRFRPENFRPTVLLILMNIPGTAGNVCLPGRSRLEHNSS